MDCTRCEELLLERGEGRLAPAGLDRVARHLTGCPRCRELALLLQSEADGSFAIPAGLAETVIARTAGAEPMARALRQLDRDLWALARAEVDAHFTADVMAATVIADQRRLSRRLAAVWQRMTQRPRLALEGAYVFGLVAFLLIGLPTSPLAGVPGDAIAQLRSDGATIQTISAPARRATELGRETVARAGGLLSDHAVSLAEVEALADTTISKAHRQARAWLSTAWESLKGKLTHVRRHDPA